MLLHIASQAGVSSIKVLIDGLVARWLCAPELMYVTPFSVRHCQQRVKESISWSFPVLTEIF